MMIQHSVIFKLKHASGTAEETAFFDAAKQLAHLPGVLNFQVFKQTSPKNQFDYGLSMEFENQADYDGYSVHPDHEQFIREFWLTNVVDFLEIDYVRLAKP
jgi:hypothetical protein